MLPGVDLNELQMTFQAKREELAKRGVPKWKRELVRALQRHMTGGKLVVTSTAHLALPAEGSAAPCV